MKIRSITLFDSLLPPVDEERLAALGRFAHRARRAYEKAGFEVQTTRLATNLLAARPGTPWASAPVDLAMQLEAACQEQGFEYISLGPAGKEMLPRLPAVFAATQRIFATAQIVDPQTRAIDREAIEGAAQVMVQAARIENGFGNLRFAALANVPPGTPFLPAAYHDDGPPAFAIATQAADLAVQACHAAPDAAAAARALTAQIEAHAARLVAVADHLVDDPGPPLGRVRFGGIDFSPAPFPTPECSIGTALETLSGAPAGSAGTLAAAALLTHAIDQAQFPRAGFCGLMLPVLEDAVLAQRAAERRLQIAALLQWSAVCGTGLDTVPLPGNTDQRALIRILLDVAALSARLQKPLTARLMPLPGKAAGDLVHFDFDYFADGGVLPLGNGEQEGLLSKTEQLDLCALGKRRIR